MFHICRFPLLFEVVSCPKWQARIGSSSFTSGFSFAIKACSLKLIAAVHPSIRFGMEGLKPFAKPSCPLHRSCAWRQMMATLCHVSLSRTGLRQKPVLACPIMLFSEPIPGAGCHAPLVDCLTPLHFTCVLFHIRFVAPLKARSCSCKSSRS